MHDASFTDELRRRINVLYVRIDDPVVRTYLDAAFVALEDQPTTNADLSPGRHDHLIDFDSPVAMIDELRMEQDSIEPLVRCRHALRSAECIWNLREVEPIHG